MIAKQLDVRIVSREAELPAMTCHNFFHSTELFRAVERTPGETPYMVLAQDTDGYVVGHMLAIIRRRGSWIPPYLFTQGYVFGEGEYESEEDKAEIFKLLLQAITRKFRRNFCLYAEFCDVSQKMFGYKTFRINGYFPVGWMEIHNSLHSKSPEERLSDKLKQRIRLHYKQGVITREVQSREELHTFYKILKNYHRMKFRRLIPHETLFTELYKAQSIRVFVTIYKNHVIGGSVCAYSEGNAYLWYMASKRKSYAYVHPGTMTVWHALDYAFKHNYVHLYFLDVGLPLPKDLFRDFILSFGGKPVSKFRWFRFSNMGVNRLLNWIFRE